MAAFEIGAVGNLRQAVVEIIVLAKIDDGRNRKTHDLVLAPSDEEFGGLVPVDDHAVSVERDHGVHRGIDDMPDQQLAAAETLGIPDVLDSASREADIGSHDHQVEGENADGQRSPVGMIGKQGDQQQGQQGQGDVHHPEQGKAGDRAVGAGGDGGQGDEGDQNQQLLREIQVQQGNDRPATGHQQHVQLHQPGIGGEIVEMAALIESVQDQAQPRQQIEGTEPPPQARVGPDLLVEIGNEAGADEDAADARGQVAVIQLDQLRQKRRAGIEAVADHGWVFQL